MPSTRAPLILLAAVPALLVGCSGPSAASSAPPPPAVTASGTPVDASPTAPGPGASPTTSEAVCPSGDYTMKSFSVTGVNGALGKGTGGDAAVEFDNGRYAIDFDDDNPIALTTRGDTGQLVVDGEIKGTYTGSGDSITFKLGTATGRATIKGEGKSRAVKLDQFAKLIGLNGKASASCSGDNLTIKVSQGTFELVRDND